MKNVREPGFNSNFNHNFQSSQRSLSESNFIKAIVDVIDKRKLNFINFSLANVLSKLTTGEKQKYYNNFLFISRSKNNIFLQFDNDKTLTAVLHFLLFFLEKKNTKKDLLLTGAFSLIKKLFIIGCLNKEDLITIFKFIIYMSFFSRETVSQDSVGELKKNLTRFSFKNLHHFYYSVDFICYIDHLEITAQFIEFVRNKITPNKTNSHLLSKEVKILELLYIRHSKMDKVIEFLSIIYSLRYNQKMIKLFFNKVKSCFTTKKNTKQLIWFLTKQIQLLNSINENENRIYDNDCYILNRGFVMNNHEKNGFLVKNIIVKGSLSFIFSFCFSPSEDTEESSQTKAKRVYPILMLKSLDNPQNNQLLISFEVRKGKLWHVSIDKSAFELCPIEEKITYVVYYEFQEKKNYFISIKSQNDQWFFKKAYKHPLNKKFNVHVGKYLKSNFEGYMGPILIFKRTFDEKFRTHLFNLKGDYEKVLFLSRYNTAQMDKYEKNINHLSDDSSFISNDYIGSVLEFKKETLIPEQLLAYISPVYSGSRLNKTIYTNKVFKETRVHYEIPPKIENGATFFFEVSSLIFEMLKYNGIYFLIFNYELIYSLLNKEEENLYIEDIINFMNELLTFTMDLFFQINIEAYPKEAKMLLFSIWKTIIKICQFRKMSGNIMTLLTKWIITLSSQNPSYSSKTLESYTQIRNQFCKILFDVKLYEMSDYATIEYFFSTLQGCIRKYPAGLITEEFFIYLLDFSKIFEGIERENKKELGFKIIRNLYKTLLISYITSNAKLDFYFILFKRLSDSNQISYKKLQLMKVFYILSENFFTNCEDEKRNQTMNFFINLFEYNCNKKETDIFLDEKGKQIFLAICIRYFFEYPKEGFYSDKNRLINKRKRSSILASSVDIINPAFKGFGNGSDSDTDDKTDYDSFSALLLKLCKYMDNSDYTLRSILITIFECNNNSSNKSETRLNFITKIKGYSDFAKFPTIINLQYYNREIRDQFVLIADLFEKNSNSLTQISYELLLFLIIKICKEKEAMGCVFNHFIASNRICSRIFKLGFLHNKGATNTFLAQFPNLIKLILPFHRNPFIFDLIYGVILTKDKSHIGKELLNHVLQMDYQPNNEKEKKYLFINKLNSALLLYKLVKNKKIWDGKFTMELDENGMMNLFNDEMLKSKFDAVFFVNKKRKTYIELLVTILLKLTTTSKNSIYAYMLRKILFQVTEGEKKSLCVRVDEFCCSSAMKKSQVDKVFFSKHKIVEVPCLTLQLLILVIRYYNKYSDPDFSPVLKDLIHLLLLDVQLLFEKKKDCKALMKDKINKDKEFLYNSFKKAIEDGFKTNSIDENSILEVFNSKYLAMKEKRKDEKEAISSGLAALNSSFSSCSSSKSLAEQCAKNHKKKYIPKVTKKTSIPKHSTVFSNDDLEVLNKTADFQNFSKTISIDYSAVGPQRDTIIYSSTQSTTKSNNTSSTVAQPSLFDISNIESSKKVVLFPSYTLIRRVFSVYFKDYLFQNEVFKKMKKYFKYYVEKVNNNNEEQNIEIENFLDYPSIFKNYTPEKFFFNGLFMKNDLDFFYDPLFPITHKYFVDQMKSGQTKRIFPKKSYDKETVKFLIKEGESNTTKFICELITNKNVVFGEIIVTNSLIYFQDIERVKFLKSLSDEDKVKYLLCSGENDYSKRKKNVFMFKKDIVEIISRRFLHQFQAFEVFLKNGKSYFFNFFTTEKRAEFFELMSKSQIRLITDLKEDFKAKEYTKKWLQGSLTNFEYLLLVNKYSSRSYNDTNQYPVFPWLYLEGQPERDLSYTTLAQTPEKREALQEKYQSFVELDPTGKKVASHYNIHYSNSSFVLYYLIRNSPFTDNQVNLQVNKFDSPNRQFNSIEELLSIINKFNDTRELIPHFFVTSDFFFNYNCNFFGFRTNDLKCIHNLRECEMVNPFEYIINQLLKFNSDEVKVSLNAFIDNIFGVGQRGKKENCNCFGKYCYQELVDLKKKIQHYKERGMKYDEMSKSILRKKETILSFGQTPYKLFEEKHPKFSLGKKRSIDDEYSDASNLVNDQSCKSIDLKEKIFFIKSSQDYSQKSVIYCLTKTNSASYYINLFDIAFFEPKKKRKKILVNKKLKFLPKLNLFNDNFIYSYKYNPKFILIDYNINIFIFCRFVDNSFVVMSSSGEFQNYLTESFVTTIAKTNDKIFMTGHLNGKIIEWELKGKSIEGSTYFNEEKIISKRNFLAHDGAVSGIYKNKELGVLITTGADKYIYIRKYFDFELLSIIHIPSMICLNLKVRNCFMYALLYDEKIEKHIVKIYNMNGVSLRQSEYALINNFDIDEHNNILVGYYNECAIDVYNPMMSKKLKRYEIFPSKTPEEKDIPKFMDFIYKKEMNGVIAAFSNSHLIKKNFNH